MTASLTVRMVDDVQVVVPDSLDLITPFVLLEQQDWFEDEIRFLRHALRPGQHVLDIGANYGVYTLSMAKTVGPSGSVVAFEPASETARLLAASIAANGFGHVKLERAALSSEAGQARLALGRHPELNALVRGAQAMPAAGGSETVPVTTLDEALRRHAWRAIDFVKMDAEGEEANILHGGARFLRELSPLVQYEIRADETVHLELANLFAQHGYASFRLVPGLGALVPFDQQAPGDGYLLNLFACKADRAETLEAAGLLLRAPAPPLREAAPGYGWRESLAPLPYARPLCALWTQTAAAGASAEVEVALALHAMSRDPALALAVRFAALQGSLDLQQQVCSQNACFLRLASLARTAREAGERALAVEALRSLAQAVNQSQIVDGREPFLAPSPRFEQIESSQPLDAWLVAAVYEEFERLSTFSTFYAGTATLQRLEMIARLGLGSEEMARRLRLVRRRFRLPGGEGP